MTDLVQVLLAQSVIGAEIVAVRGSECAQYLLPTIPCAIFSQFFFTVVVRQSGLSCVVMSKAQVFLIFLKERISTFNSKYIHFMHTFTASMSLQPE